MQRLKIGISPCPNDTFVFENLFFKKIKNGNYTLEFHLMDIEELNSKMLNGDLDVAKISCALIPLIYKNYYILKSGGAAGFGLGPIIVCKKGSTPISQKSNIFLPGKHTTANFLFHCFYPQCKNVSYVSFEKVEQEVLKHQNSYGVLIHEKRFSYHQKTLIKKDDLGNRWEQHTNLPLPLGCVAVSKNISKEIVKQLSEDIMRSILTAFERKELLSDFIISHAQDIDKETITKHIMMYVNLYSLDFRSLGITALNKIFSLQNISFNSKLEII